MVALAACQKEVQETVQQPVLDEGLDGEMVEVTFTVDVTILVGVVTSFLT